MKNFQITADVIQNLVREKMLQGDFEEAKEILSECLFGINDKQINLIVEGEAVLIDTADGIDIVNHEDNKYKEYLKKVRDKNISPEEVRKTKSETLKKQYQKNHNEFIYHTTENEKVYFPKVLMDKIVDEGTDDLIKELDLLINPYISDLEKTNILIYEIKSFGYQIMRINLFRENNTFGRFTGKIKTLKDKNNLKDTDILFLDLEERESIVKYFSLFEKVGAVIGYATMTSLLAHHDIFHKSKESYMQIPLLLINKGDGMTFRNMEGQILTLDLKRNFISKK